MLKLQCFMVLQGKRDKTKLDLGKGAKIWR